MPAPESTDREIVRGLRHLPQHGRRSLAAYADPNIEIEALSRALDESVEQQTATRQILGVISNASTDLEPVFKTT